MARFVTDQLQERSFIIVVGKHSLHLDMLWNQEEIKRLDALLLFTPITLTPSPPILRASWVSLSQLLLIKSRTSESNTLC